MPTIVSVRLVHLRMVAAVLVAVGVAATDLAAEDNRSFDLSICKSAALEIEALKASGIEEVVAKGPEWVRAHAPPGDVARVQRFIELEEQVRFRCPVDLARRIREAMVPPPPARRPAIAFKAPRKAPVIPLPERKARPL